MSSAKGVGANLPRKEDHRLLHGRGEFVADIAMPGTMDVAFVRSPLAHARIRGAVKPVGDDAQVYTAADLAEVRPIVARSGLPGFKVSEQPVLADGRVRYAGEPIAACVARSRAEAEDLANRVVLDLEELPAVSDMLRARDPDAPLLHPGWGDNVFLESVVDGDLSGIERRAAVSVTRTFRTARQCMSPIEGRGVLAYWDRRLEMLVLHTACQIPHIVRTGLAQCLGLEQGQVRIIVPDVGGGFGYKGILLPEEVVLGWIAMQRDHPVRWIEDRREQLVANANCREHHYVITAHAEADGALLALDCEAHVDAGAYSSYPFSACLEAAQVASILPGPYVFEAYRCRTWSMATNKPPILPYRGVARTGVCFALEVLLDRVARALDMDPVELRLRNLVKPQQMPFDNITGKHFDSGDYPECLRRAAEAIDLRAVRERQRRGETDGRRVGVGFSIFCEQAAHGTSVYAAWGVPMIPGHEQAGARMTPSGGLEIRVGLHSHGQGLETTLAQVAHEVLGIDPAGVNVVHGDTALTPYSTGTWGSRAMVMAGGAVAAACEVLGARIA
ncbi:MAG: xanthine dehydrogenase family protein, partial [Gammaproteobacteria bacterium]|nr:xanthine dehydrogenase family protein [Gammaproteobacteria bacterium]